MHIAVCLAALLGNPEPLTPEFVSLFDAREFAPQGKRGPVYSYRLFVPKITDQTIKYPLIVWLNGRGEDGSDNVEQLRWLDTLIFHEPRKKDRYPFFLLAPQSPRRQSGPVKGRGATSQDDFVELVAAITAEVTRRFAVDPDRVCLVGLSSGGSRCWTVAARHPDLFAAVAPLASSVSGRSKVERLAGIPVWAFHSTRDTATRIDSVRRAADALASAGGSVALTEIDSAEHDCWQAAFQRYHLLDWLLDQRRGAPGIRPGSLSLRHQVDNLLDGWRWWQLAAQVLVMVGIASAARWTYQRVR